MKLINWILLIMVGLIAMNCAVPYAFDKVFPQPKSNFIESLDEGMQEDVFKVQSEIRMLAISVYGKCPGLGAGLDYTMSLPLKEVGLWYSGDNTIKKHFSSLAGSYVWLRNDYGLSHYQALDRVKNVFTGRVKEDYNYLCPRVFREYHTKNTPLPPRKTDSNKGDIQ